LIRRWKRHWICKLNQRRNASVESTSVFRRWFNFQTKPKIDRKSTSGCDVESTSERRWICDLNRRRNETSIQRLYFDVDSTFKLNRKSTENRRQGATSNRRLCDVCVPIGLWSYSHLTPKKLRVTWPWPRPLFANFFSGVMSGLYLESYVPNFKFATLAILELLAFNPPKIKGHVTVTTPPFREFFSGIMSGLLFQTSVPNFIKIG